MPSATVEKVKGDDPLAIHDEYGRMRVKVVRAAGTQLPGGYVAADPAKAQEHMDEFGWAEEGHPFPAEPTRGNPKITLDSGEVIWGYECWWQQQYTVAGKRACILRQIGWHQSDIAKLEALLATLVDLPDDDLWSIHG